MTQYLSSTMLLGLLLPFLAVVIAIPTHGDGIDLDNSVARDLGVPVSSLTKRDPENYVIGVQNYDGGSWVVAVPNDETNPCTVVKGKWKNAGRHWKGMLHQCVRFQKINDWEYNVCDGKEVWGNDGMRYGICDHTSDRYDCQENDVDIGNFQAFARCNFGKTIL